LWSIGDTVELGDKRAVACPATSPREGVAVTGSLLLDGFNCGLGRYLVALSERPG
jgi:hypothetical protein